VVSRVRVRPRASARLCGSGDRYGPATSSPPKGPDAPAGADCAPARPSRWHHVRQALFFAIAQTVAKPGMRRTGLCHGASDRDVLCPRRGPACGRHTQRRAEERPLAMMPLFAAVSRCDDHARRVPVRLGGALHPGRYQTGDVTRRAPLWPCPLIFLPFFPGVASEILVRPMRARWPGLRNRAFRADETILGNPRNGAETKRA
jgi:hypothetical protein